MLGIYFLSDTILFRKHLSLSQKVMKKYGIAEKLDRQRVNMVEIAHTLKLRREAYFIFCLFAFSWIGGCLNKKIFFQIS